MFYVTGLMLFLVTSGAQLTAAIDYYNISGVLYIKPDSGTTNWQNAQSSCRALDSTLCILDTAAHRNSFIEALKHFGLYNEPTWIGASATYGGADNWRWLNGANYTGPAVQGLQNFFRSYATISKPQTSIIVNASTAVYRYNYLCQYRDASYACASGRILFRANGFCYVASNDDLPWFTARNNCLSNGGDLAILPDLNSVGPYLDSTVYWIGLSSSSWYWQNAVSFDVTYTFWAFSQPNNDKAECMAINSGDELDDRCDVALSFICQKGEEYSTASTTSARPLTVATYPSTSQIPIAKGSTSTSKSTTLSSTTLSSKSSSVSDALSSVLTSDGTSKTIDTTTTNVPLALIIGVAVGVGVAVIVINVIIVIIVTSFRRKQKRGKEQNTRDQVDNPPPPPTSPTPLTYMQLRIVDRLEGHEYAKIGYSPNIIPTHDYLELRTSTNDSEYMNSSDAY